MSADRFTKGGRSSNCLAFEAQLFDYMDSLLSVAEMQAMEQHAAECGTCRLELEHVRRAETALLSSSLSIPAPGDLYSGFANKLAVRQTKTRLLQLRHMGPAFALAVLALILFNPWHRHEMHGTNGLGSASPGKTATFALNDGDEWDLNLDLGDIERNTGIGSSVTSRAGHKSPARNRRIARERSVNDLSLGRNEARNTTRRAAENSIVAASIAGEQLADNLDATPADASKKQLPRLRIPEATDFAGTASDLYAATDSPQVGSRELALGLLTRRYVAPESEQTQGAGFALLVEDDVRGFTAEAHNTASSGPQVSQPHTETDDGVKVEVELDETAGPTSF